MKTKITFFFSMVIVLGQGQQINYSYNGSNGANGLSEYGIVTQASGGQALLGAEAIGDLYANLNLGSNISGTRRFWHISKRTASDGHSLQFYYFDGTSFQVPRLTLSPNGNIGVGISSPAFRFHIKGGNANSDAMTLGNTSTGNFALTSSDGGAYGLFAGVSNTGRAWLQAGRYDSNLAYDLVLQSSGGNVGLGTTSPSAKLEIYSSTTTGSTLFYGGVIGSKANGHELNLVGGTPVDGQYTSQLGGHIRLGGSARGDTEINAIQFLQNGSEKMRINNGGNVGIGTVSPQWKLDVAGLISSNGQAVINVAANEISLGDVAGGDGYRDKLHLHTRDQKRVTIDENGNVGIGTTSPNQKLTVNGTIYGKEVKVDLNVPGPDYVFEKDYKLPSLDEIKSYIDQHKHLPEVPSAKEMEQNGINLSEMNMILLKKVEELTLFIVDQKKELTNQQAIIENLKQRVDQLEKK